MSRSFLFEEGGKKIVWSLGIAQTVADIARTVAVFVFSFATEPANVLVVVEFAVRASDEDADIGVLTHEAIDSFRGGKDANEGDVVRAAILQKLNRQTHGTAGGEHGVQNETWQAGQARANLFLRDLADVDVGLCGCLVADHADVPYVSFREKLTKRRKDAETRTQDRNKRAVHEPDAAGGAEWGFDLMTDRRQLTCRFDGKEVPKAPEQDFDALGIGRLVAQLREHDARGGVAEKNVAFDDGHRTSIVGSP